MAVVAPPREKPAPLPPLPIYRFTVDQYHRMVPAGILSAEDPVELLEGLIVIKGNSTLAPAISAAPVLANHRPGPTSPMPVRRFTVEQYQRMSEMGILGEDERVELVEGWVIVKMGRNPPHDAVIALVLRILGLVLPTNWHCRGQSALTTDTGQTEPDVAVVRGSERDYLVHHPRPRETGMVVEVAETTLQTDRSLKAVQYARVGIPVYWIINLAEGQVEVYTDPTGPDPEPCYRKRQDYRNGESVPVVLDGQEVARIPVSDFLP